jgi:hypothetical protein
MTQTNRSLICIAAALLVCLLAVGTVSAYDPDTACTSLMNTLNSTSDLSAIELVHTYTDGSYGYFGLRTEYAINPKEDVSRELRDLIECDGEDGYVLAWIILTTVADNQRVSYALMHETSEFRKLLLPIPLPDSSSPFGDPLNHPAEKIDNAVQFTVRQGANMAQKGDQPAGSSIASRVTMVDRSIPAGQSFLAGVSPGGMGRIQKLKGIPVRQMIVRSPH